MNTRLNAIAQSSVDPTNGPGSHRRRDRSAGVARRLARAIPATPTASGATNDTRTRIHNIGAECGRMLVVGFDDAGRVPPRIAARSNRCPDSYRPPHAAPASAPGNLHVIDSDAGRATRSCIARGRVV